MPKRSPDKRLFTPGPLTTSHTVKEAMLHDLGSRDEAFLAVVAEIRARLLDLAGVSTAAGFEAILLQGSGTYGVEAMINSVVPKSGRLLVLENGAYGRRMETMATRAGIPVETLSFSEDQPVDPEVVRTRLAQAPTISHVAMVHCETTTGIMNPLATIAPLVADAKAELLVDAMSSFGAVPIDLGELAIDFLVSSANKCIEGVPGFAFLLCQRQSLERSAGVARTVSLDLHEQWRGLESNGQFRFTPPTHVLLAFLQALRELEEEGGVAARGARYRANHEALLAGMRTLGFQEYIAPERQGPMITTFLEPGDPAFDFERFYRGLAARDLVIYPGKLAERACFRIGTVGRLSTYDIEELLEAIPAVLREMGVAVPVSEPRA